jgi:imidazolonepropionase-like amidohydrolase
MKLVSGTIMQYFNRRIMLVLALAGLLLPSSLAAQAIFINDATLHTMGRQSVLQQADLLIRDGRIRSVGLDLSAPADATVIEAGGRPVTPGFFAGISVLGLQDIPAEEATVDHGLQLEAIRPEFDVTLAFNPHSEPIRVSRVEGCTWSVLWASRSGSIVGGQGQAVSLDGGFDSFLGDKILFIDVGSDASGQSGGSRAAQWMLLNQAMEEARSEVRWSPEALLTVAGRKAMAAFSGDGIVVFNVDRASDILQVLEFAQLQEINPVILGGAEAWMLADRLAEAGVPVLLNPLLNLPGNFDQLGARLDNAAILHEAGVSIGFKADVEEDSRRLRHAAGNAVANGLPYEAALQALTSTPAAIFDIGENSGTLAENSPADLVIWSGDPLEVTSAADQVIIAGKLIPMVSRQTLLRDRYLPENPEMPRAYIKP